MLEETQLTGNNIVTLDLDKMPLMRTAILNAIGKDDLPTISIASPKINLHVGKVENMQIEGAFRVYTEDELMAIKIQATKVKKFRELTGVGMMDSKKILAEYDFDLDKALASYRDAGHPRRYHPILPK